MYFQRITGPIVCLFVRSAAPATVDNRQITVRSQSRPLSEQRTVKARTIKDQPFI